MAEGVTFPSPSTLLRSSPPRSSPPPSVDPTATVNKPKHVRRQSKEAPKSSSSKKAAVATGSGAVRPKQSKSRNGCVTCKAKRLKCDESKPKCQQCAKRNVECGGYKRDFKWRPFDEADAKLMSDRQKRASSPTATENHSTALSSTSLASRERSSAAVQKHSRPAHISRRITHRPSPSSTSPAISPIATSLLGSSSQADLSSCTAGTSGQVEDIHHNNGIPENSQHIQFENRSPMSGIVLSRTNSSQHQPRPGSATNLSPDQTVVPFTLPDDLDFSWINTDRQAMDGDAAPMDEQYLDENAIDDLMGSDTSGNALALPSPFQLTSPVTGAFQSFDLTMSTTPLPSPDPLQMIVLASDTNEMLLARFDQMTCGILSIMDGPTENPWRTLIWPLASQSPALSHAIMAMTAYHHSNDVPSLRLTGHEHKHESLKFIREGISENSIGKQTAIATALALGFAESWDRHIDTGNTHIKGAQALVKSALEDHKRNPLGEVDLQRLKFLCNAWVYMDVIARLTAIQSDESTDFDNTFLFSHNPPPTVLGNISADHHGFGIDFGMPIDARLDPLMGCAGTLFPLIGRVANLVRRVCRSKTNSPSTVDTGQLLQEQLEDWTPPLYIVDPEDPTTSPQHALQTAEAYRLATLLHLHQSVPELPSPSATQLARKVMTCLATVPVKSRLVIVHIFPLMVAGCLAGPGEDRQWVRQRWTRMAQRMRIGVVDRCLQVTEEVWRRRDDWAKATNSKPVNSHGSNSRGGVPDQGPGTGGNRPRLVATADLLPARSKGERYPRSPPSASSPRLAGRGGMVYSMLRADDDPADALEEEAMLNRPMSGASRPVGAAGGGGSTSGGADGGMMVLPEARQMMGSMDVAYTPRGHAHWVGVMWDWGWEVLLG